MKIVAIYVFVVSLLSALLLVVTKHDRNAARKVSIAEDYIPSSDRQAIPKFEFTGQNNKLVENRDFEGHWTFLFFGFTSCAHVCPVALATISKFISYLSDHAKGEALAKFAFITLDPDNDDPLILKEYLQAFSPKLLGLSDNKPSLAKLLNFFSASVDDIENHSTAVFLIDPAGIYRGHFVRALEPAVMNQWLEKISRNEL